MEINTTDYKKFIQELKENIKTSRNIALLRVNEELIKLYFNIGKKISQKQKESKWGDDLIGKIEKDLKQEFSNIKGFSRRNLIYMKKMYTFFEEEIMPQAVAQIPWGHIRLILDKIKHKEEALFYVKETIEHGWSRVVLEHQIELNLYQRKGNLVSNFQNTIKKEEINLIQNSFKENYILDFLDLKEDFKERDLEDALITNISNFLIELGKGFAFVGRQKKITIGGDEFFIDLLFYNYVLKRFIVIEIKTSKFKPEHLGQISFYINAIDKDIKGEHDKETIGLLICKSKNKTVVEYALSNNKKPLGVAEYYLKDFPVEIKNYLPSERDLEEVLK